jgi:hypothetical protein
MFSPELERNAFLANNSEFGWTRAQIPMVVNVLRSQKMAILGGELWWVRNGSEDWVGTIPQRHGPPGVYVWESNREPGEPWPHFVERSASGALAAMDRFPAPGDVPPDLHGRIFYNLTWISEVEFEKLSTKAVVAESFADIEAIRNRAKPLDGLSIKDLIAEGRR